MTPIDPQDLLSAGAFALTAILCALSFAAFVSTRDRRLLFVAVAFALWAVRLGINALAIFVFPDWEGATWVETESIVLDFVTPAIIFLAIVRRDAATD